MPRQKAEKKKKRTVFLPVLFGITVAFALACAALCWMILNDSSSLMGEKGRCGAGRLQRHDPG